MKYKIIGLLFIIACLVFFFYLKNHQTIIVAQSIPSQLKPYKTEFEKLDELSKTKPKEAEKKIEALIKKLPKKSQRWFNFGVNAGKVSVGFYGKVIDQYGKPLEGIKVHYHVTGSYLSHGSGPGFVTTNSSGIFHTKGSGAVLYIENFIHPSIEFKHEADDHYGGRVEDWYRYKQDNPKVYKVWRTESYAHVLQSDKGARGGRGTLNIDGSLYIVDFFEKNRKHGYKKGTDQVGQLIVNCEREPIKRMEYGLVYTSWKYTLRPVNGGIQATKDYYMNKAPIDGYKPSIIVERDSSPKNSRLMSQKYYFTTVVNNQLSYGNLMINFEPHNTRRYKKEGEILYVPTCRIQIVARINLEGGRSLSVKARQY